MLGGNFKYAWQTKGQIFGKWHTHTGTGLHDTEPSNPGEDPRSLDYEFRERILDNKFFSHLKGGSTAVIVSDNTFTLYPMFNQVLGNKNVIPEYKSPIKNYRSTSSNGSTTLSRYGRFSYKGLTLKGNAK